jgi:RNA polymerase sigma-70 factor, ECF subfamily
VSSLAGLIDETVESVGLTVVAVARSAPLPVAAQTDDELVKAICAGDETAFALLFERHRRYVTSLAFRFFQRRELVEEIVQESFAKAYFALESYRGGQERSFMAWLARITVFACYDELRRAQRRAESSLSDLNEELAAHLLESLPAQGESSDVEGRAVVQDLASRLLARLNPEDRLALTMIDMAGFSVAEMAATLGWTAAKVKTRAFRARAALRRVLRKLL